MGNLFFFFFFLLFVEVALVYNLIKFHVYNIPFLLLFTLQHAKSDGEGSMPYDLTHMWNLKYKQWTKQVHLFIVKSIVIAKHYNEVDIYQE